MIKFDGDMSWELVKKFLKSKNLDIEFSEEEEMFICPICGEPIYKEDFPMIPVEFDENFLSHPMCPVCKIFFED